MSAVKQSTEPEPSQFKLVAMPVDVGDIVAKFMVDKGYGNITLNIQDGQIKKVVIEQHFKIG